MVSLNGFEKNGTDRAADNRSVFKHFIDAAGGVLFQVPQRWANAL